MEKKPKVTVSKKRKHPLVSGNKKSSSLVKVCPDNGSLQLNGGFCANLFSQSALACVRLGWVMNGGQPNKSMRQKNQPANQPKQQKKPNNPLPHTSKDESCTLSIEVNSGRILIFLLHPEKAEGTFQLILGVIVSG